MDVVGFSDYFIALAIEVADGGEGAGLVFPSAAVIVLEAEIGALGLAFGVDADFGGLFVVYAGHMFHFGFSYIYFILAGVSANLYS